MKKFLMTAVIAIMIALVAACGTSGSQLYELIDSGNVNGVVELYTKHYNGDNAKLKFCNKLLEYGEKIYDDYNNERISFDDGYEKYDTIIDVAECLDLDDRISDSYDKFLSLQSSKENFVKCKETVEKLRQNEYGNDLEKRGKIAAECTKKLKRISEDDTNRAEAEILIEELKPFVQEYLRD